MSIDTVPTAAIGTPRGTQRRTIGLMLSLLGAMTWPGLAAAQEDGPTIAAPEDGALASEAASEVASGEMASSEMPSGETGARDAEPIEASATTSAGDRTAAPEPPREAIAAPPEATASPAASVLSAPAAQAAPVHLRLDVDEERPPGYRPNAIPTPPPAETRARDWRYSRLRTLRPQTLPQGALRLENTKSVGYLGTVGVGVQFSVAAGLHDDFEIGGTPLGLGLSGIFPSPHDPEAYARLRVLSGPVQLAFRSNVVFPLVSDDLQWGLTAELAWTLEDWLRVDTGLDYQMLFDQPFQQRVGIPLAVTLQGGINAVTLTTAAYVFNDFDDVDVPLLVRYSVAFGGHQGPIAEVGMEGGFLDVIPDPDLAWTVRANVTWYAYLGNP